MNMKKILSLVLVLVLALSVMTGCSLFGGDNKNDNTDSNQNQGTTNPPADDNAATVSSAIAYLGVLYGSQQDSKDSADYDVVSKVMLNGGADVFTVTWASNNASIVIKESTQEGYYTVDLPASNDTEVEYTLTATVTDAKGETAEYTLNKVLAVYGEKVEGASVLEEGVAYKLYISQGLVSKHLFAIHDLNNGRMKSSEDYTAAPDFYAEKVDGGYKFYTMIDGAKKYVEAYQSLSSDGTKTYNNFKFEDSTEDVWSYDADYKCWCVTLEDNGVYVLGTYNDSELFQLSKYSYITAADASNQYVASFITADQAADLPAFPTVDPVTPPETVVPAVTGKYNLVVTQVNLNKNIYVNGAIANSYYLATSDDIADAALVELEAVDGVDGAFRMFFMNGEAKTYIVLMERTDKAGSGTIQLTTETPEVYYTWDADYNTAIVTNGDNKFFLGSYGTYETVSASAYKYIADNYSIKFIEVEAPVAADPLAELDGEYDGQFYETSFYTFTFDKTAGTLAIVDNNAGIYTGTYNYTYSADAGITVDGATIVFAVTDAGTVTATMGTLTVDLVAASGSEDDDAPEGATILEPTDVAGTITLEATDTYCYVDLYGFKAPATATYWFEFAKGTGLQTVASYDAWDNPEVDFYEGGVFSVTLEEGEVCYFYFAATSYGEYEINYSNEEIVVIPPVALQSGANTVTFTADNALTGIECVLTPYSNGAYTFKSDTLGANIYDSMGNLVGRNYAELEGYCEYTVVVYFLDETTAAAGDYTLNIVAPIFLTYNYDTTIELDADQIADGFNAYVTPYNPGTIAFNSDTLTVVGMTDADGNELVANADGSYNVLGWTKYTVTFAAKEGAAAGEHTVSPVFTYAPGTAQNPYTLEATTNVTLIAEGTAYYQYVATADGYLTISGDATNLRFRDADWNTYLVTDAESIFVFAGQTYLFTFSTTDYLAIETSVSVAFVEGEATEEVYKSILEGEFFYVNDEYQVNFSEGMMVVTLYDYNTWAYTIKLNYSYTVTANDDGSLTIVPTYVYTEGEIGSDFGFSGATVTATTGEYGYEFACELVDNGGDDSGDDSGESAVTYEEVTNVAINAADTSYTYTASAAGTLKLVAGNAIMGDVAISYTVNGGDAVVLELGSTVELELAAGDVVVISVVAAGYSNVKVYFAAAEGGAAVEEPTSVAANLTYDGVANAVTLEADTYAYAELYIYGNYQISWDVEGLVVLVNNVAVANGGVFNAASPMIATVITINGADYAAVEANVTIKEYVVELATGDNTVSVTNTWNGTPVQFTASAAGTYVFTAGTNTTILTMGDYGYEPVESGVYTVALAEGEVLSIVVITTDYSVGDVAVNVVKDYDTLTIPEAVEMGNTNKADSADKYYITGVITSIVNATYGNVYIVDAEGNELYVYGLYDTEGNKYGSMATKPAVGQTVKLLSVVSYYYATGAQLKDATVISCTDEALNDTQKAAIEKAACDIETSYDADATVDLIAAGATYTDVTITWTVDGVAATQLVIAQTSEVQNIAVVATITSGEVSVTKEFAVVVSAKLADNAFTTSYTFSNYTAGTQYAEGEEHVLDEYVTCTTTQAHFTSQLRLYSSSTNDGYAVFTCTNVVDAISFNAGNKTGTLNVYGSTNGTDWVLIEGVAITSTSYTDYALDVDADAGYTYIKLDVDGTNGNQVRVASIGFTFIK